MTRSRCRRRLERIERPNIIHHQALAGLQWPASQCYTPGTRIAPAIAVSVVVSSLKAERTGGGRWPE